MMHAINQGFPDIGLDLLYIVIDKKISCWNYLLMFGDTGRLHLISLIKCHML